MRSFLTILLLITATFSFSQDYDIYVSDAGNFNNPPWQILKFDSSGQNPTVFINNNLNWPQDILFMEDSNFVLISNLGTGKISRYNASTGAYLSDFATSIGGPTRIKIGPDSLLYVLQWNGNGKVKRYNLDGTYVDDFTSAGVPQSIGLDWDSNGNLYVSSYNGDLVRKFDTNGIDQGVFISANLAGPTNIWFDVNGDLLVSDYDGTAVKRFNSSGVYLGDFLTGLSHSEGVVYLPNGNILIGNGTTNSVKQFDGNGTYINDRITSGSGNLINPNAIAVRMKNSAGVPEIKGDIQNIIYPNMGSEFHINDQYANAVKSVDVFNSTGSLVESFKDESWTASNFSNGTYFISIYLLDGSRVNQKVVVKK